MAKEKKEKKKVDLKKKGASVIEEFKKFISRGNVLDMSVGVIMGGAFGAIVTAFTNILLSLATWGVPGGLKGLVTPLPAINPAQEGPVGQVFQNTELAQKTIEYASGQGVTISAESDTFIQWQNALLGKYTLHGTSYFYNQSAIIDWGALINAVISFLIIAIVLFIVIKIVAVANKKKAEWDAAALERYYQKHPEARPAPVEPEAPKPTELEILMEIRDSLKKEEKK